MKVDRRGLVLDGIISALLAALVWILYRKVLRLWWMYDDPFLLNMVGDRELWKLMFDPVNGGVPLFTPLLLVSLKADHAAFALQAPAFYAHQLAAFALLHVLEYSLLRLWCARIAAAAAVVVSMIGAALLEIVPLLMLRHYIEGAAFSMVAIMLFVLAVRRGSMSFAGGSAIAYFAAACCKEIYVPLLLLLSLIPEGTVRQRLRLLFPHLGAAILYAVWRLAMIGTNVGAYGAVAAAGEQPLLLATLPFRIVRQFAGSGTVAGWLLLTLVVASAAVVMLRIRDARLVALAGLAVALLPIVPLAAEMERRWAFALWLLASAAIAFLPRALPRGGTVAAVVVAAAALVAFRMEWPQTYRNLKRMSDEARVLSLIGPLDIVRNPLTPPTTMLELQRLTGTRGRAFYDDMLLCDRSQHVGRVFEYDPRRKEVIETSRAAINRSCASVVNRPLEVRLHFDAHGTLHWSLGPYPKGKWAFIIGEGIAAYEVPPRGTFRRVGWDKFNVRVRYTSPQGWRTYSPWLPVDSARPPVHYHRPPSAPPPHPTGAEC